MLEIVFSESACGGLKIAQNYGRGEYLGGINGILLSHEDGREPTKEEIEAAIMEAKEKDRLEWERATPLGGNSNDVFELNLELSIGDISESQPGNKRMKVLERLFSVYSANPGQEVVARVNETLERLWGRIAEGESIRIWYSNNPNEMCGLFWFMWQLSQRDINTGQVIIVKLPDWEIGSDQSIIRMNNWGEVSPGSVSRYLEHQKPVEQEFIKCCAEQWLALMNENASLRAVLNGRLVSVSEELYDDVIKDEIATEGEIFREATIIGQVISRRQLGISDTWITLRIDKMIQEGIMEVLSEAGEDMPRCHRMLKKA